MTDLETATRGQLAVLYGSQTGTAQDTAERIAREGTRLRFKVKVTAMDDYDLSELLAEEAVVFVCSTTGQGEEPDNMKKTWRFLLRRSLPRDALADLDFAVLGLGDSSYPKFNFVAKRLVKRLVQLGGHAFQESGLADDQHDLGADGTIVPWIKALKQNLSTLFPLPNGQVNMNEGCLLPSKFSVAWEEGESADADVVRIAKGVAPSADCPLRAKVIGNERITDESHWQDVRKISFDISDSNIEYFPGDVLLIRPSNSEQSVSTFLGLLELDPNKKFRLTPNDDESFQVPTTLPSLCSIGYLVKNFLDINSIPRLYFWELLGQFTDDENEKEKLDEFLTPEGTQDLWDYCNRMRRNYVEVLHDFPFATRRIPFQYLFDLIPPLQPRAFSIASAQTKHGSTLEILMAVVRYKTKLFEPRLGVCSNWLAKMDLKTESCALIWTRSGTMTFPPSPTPLIMIGPGTGVAPFRNVIHHRIASTKGSNECNLFLFFGCRNREKDFYCQKEWQEFESEGSLKHFVAFSRDQEETVYVQDKLLEQSELVWDLIDRKNGCIFVAGNAKRMPEDIWATFRKIVIKNNNGLSEIEAEEYMKNLERNERYQTETWS